MTKKRHGNNLFTEAERFDIYKRVQAGEKQIDVAKSYNANPATITTIINSFLEMELKLYRNKFYPKQ